VYQRFWSLNVLYEALLWASFLHPVATLFTPCSRLGKNSRDAFIEKLGKYEVRKRLERAQKEAANQSAVLANGGKML